MDMNRYLKVGSEGIKTYLVRTEDTADSIGNKNVIALSTPTMVKFMENTATGIIMKKIPEGYSPIGTKVDINHINPAPVNTKVTVKATLISIEGRRLRYNLEVFNEKYKIGFGIYEQYIVQLENFLYRHHIVYK